MSIAPDFSTFISSFDVYLLVRPVLLVGIAVAMLICAVVAIDNILKLLGFDIMENVRAGRDHEKYNKRYRRESDESRYKKWKQDRGF